MIYVNQKQLDQVEYLIEQSCRGYHVLFDADIIRTVFADSSRDDESEDNAKEDSQIEKHIENLILQPTLVSKRAYLENLTRPTLKRLVKTYFSIVENNLAEAQEFHQ